MSLASLGHRRRALSSFYPIVYLWFLFVGFVYAFLFDWTCINYLSWYTAFLMVFGTWTMSYRIQLFRLGMAFYSIEPLFMILADTLLFWWCLVHVPCHIAFIHCVRLFIFCIILWRWYISPCRFSCCCCWISFYSTFYWLSVYFMIILQLRV